MAHVQTINYTSRKYHTKRCQEAGEWRYPVIGAIRKGWFRPYHGQVFIDDWRIPDICVEQFSVDMGLKDPVAYVKSVSKSGVLKMASPLVLFMIKLLRKLGPWDNRKFNKPKPMYRASGWNYNLILGVVKDPIQLCKSDGKRKEVL